MIVDHFKSDNFTQRKPSFSGVLSRLTPIIKLLVLFSRMASYDAVKVLFLGLLFLSGSLMFLADDVMGIDTVADTEEEPRDLPPEGVEIGGPIFGPGLLAEQARAANND